MARTQFTFTFTNAQPGADVGFNFPAFADSSTTVADGTLVLDSTNSVSVWADAAYLIAHTVDGRGVQILGVATSAYPTQTIDAGVPGPNPFPSGGSTPGASVVRAFPFDHSTPSLVTGHTVWTPAVGDILIDAWIEVGTAWNGTTPKGDFAQFIGGDPNGCFEDQNAAVDLTVADVSAGASMPTGLLYQNVPGSQPASLLSMQANVAAGVVRTQRRVPAKFTTADPVKVVVTQDGTQGGADAGATAGAAILYLVTCTPAT